MKEQQRIGLFMILESILIVVSGAVFIFGISSSVAELKLCSRVNIGRNDVPPMYIYNMCAQSVIKCLER